MSYSPKVGGGTAFSVTDILSYSGLLPSDSSVADETLKKASLDIPPIFPTSASSSSHYPRSSSVGTMSSMAAAAAAAGSMAAANAAYNWGQLSHQSFQQNPYCNNDFSSGYGDPMRNSSSSWYTANADPRIASEYSMSREQNT